MPSRKTGKRKKLNPPGLSQTVRRRDASKRRGKVHLEPPDDLQYNLESNYGVMLSEVKSARYTVR
jgi:hypothetical protein